MKIICIIQKNYITFAKFFTNFITKITGENSKMFYKELVY